MKPQPPRGPAALRREAEAKLSAKSVAVPPRNEADLRRLQHELEVHQIELEMQNEELRASQTEIEAGLERYTDLYDFAPVGYLTLDRSGSILAANLTVARLLGVERAGLLNRGLASWLAQAHKAAFFDFLEKTFASATREGCEVELPRAGSASLFVRIEGVASGDGLECRAAVMDVTERHRAEIERDRTFQELRSALAQIKQLSGMLPICASCKQIRDDHGYWIAVEVYITSHSEATFSHGLCPQCVAKMREKMNE